MSERSSSPPLELDPATLAILGSFMADKAEEERRFKELEAKAQAVFDDAQGQFSHSSSEAQTAAWGADDPSSCTRRTRRGNDDERGRVQAHHLRGLR